MWPFDKKNNDKYKTIQCALCNNDMYDVSGFAISGARICRAHDFDLPAKLLYSDLSMFTLDEMKYIIKKEQERRDYENNNAAKICRDTYLKGYKQEKKVK